MLVKTLLYAGTMVSFRVQLAFARIVLPNLNSVLCGYTKADTRVTQNLAKWHDAGKDIIVCWNDGVIPRTVSLRQDCVA